jgi:hypothetical protein
MPYCGRSQNVKNHPLALEKSGNVEKQTQYIRIRNKHQPIKKNIPMPP